MCLINLFHSLTEAQTSVSLSCSSQYDLFMSLLWRAKLNCSLLGENRHKRQIYYSFHFREKIRRRVTGSALILWHLCGVLQLQHESVLLSKQKKHSVSSKYPSLTFRRRAFWRTSKNRSSHLQTHRDARNIHTQPIEETTQN